MDILYRDDTLVAVNKPAGLLVHRSAIDHHETRYALQIVRDQLGRRVYPVHRLDKPTSGILVFALDQDTARRMTKLFAEGAVEKTYLAVVRGYTDEAGTIDYALEEQLDRMTDNKALRDKPAQPAVTHYRRLGIAELPFAVGRYPTARYSLLRVSPKTGRKHQIRRHMKHIFHPVVGDTSHGDGRHNAFLEPISAAVACCSARPAWRSLIPIRARGSGWKRLWMILFGASWTISAGATS